MFYVQTKSTVMHQNYCGCFMIGGHCAVCPHDRSFLACPSFPLWVMTNSRQMFASCCSLNKHGHIIFLCVSDTKNFLRECSFLDKFLFTSHAEKQTHNFTQNYLCCLDRKILAFTFVLDHDYENGWKHTLHYYNMRNISVLTILLCLSFSTPDS